MSDIYIDRGTVAAPCPGCGLLVRFWAEDLAARDDPSARDVLCAFCGSEASLDQLTARLH